MHMEFDFYIPIIAEAYVSINKLATGITSAMGSTLSPYNFWSIDMFKFG